MEVSSRSRCLSIGMVVLLSFPLGLLSSCSDGCELALASFYVWTGSDMTIISNLFSSDIPTIISYNPGENLTRNFVPAGIRINIPFSCDCIENEILGHQFLYNTTRGDTYTSVARRNYSNLTTPDWIQRFNSYGATSIPATASLNVTVNCSCGNSDVSDAYGLFLTYPLSQGETLASISSNFNLSSDLLRRYNPDSNFSSESGLLFIPARDLSGQYPTLKSRSTGISGGAIAGIVIGVLSGILILLFLYYKVYKRKRNIKKLLLPSPTEGPFDNATSPLHQAFPGITVDKSVEFSYDELANATAGFSMANKIGEGAFGSVYYAELRDEKVAIKKMDMQSKKEFFAELKVLTHVHHVNLVKLIGFCIESSLFLVYEFIDNGNLREHLRGLRKDPLQWMSRVQIALDSARGLEYIHEHTAPMYIHRDIKSANILIDSNLRGKVGDFGLTKLMDVGNVSFPTGLAGTFGYMPPEYAQFGDVSVKVDVYAFGVVLYELVSGKEAIVKMNDTEVDSRGLVSMFDEAFDGPDPAEKLRNLVDPQLGNDYPPDSVFKMAQLARSCTLFDPKLRPSMRSVVVALMTFSSTESWDVKNLYEDQAFINLMSGR